MGRDKVVGIVMVTVTTANGVASKSEAYFTWGLSQYNI